MATNLTSIDGFPFDVKASTDFCESAENSAKLCMRAKEKLDSIFGFSPSFTLYLLDKQDWASVASMPTYGIPHADARRIVMSAEKSEFWQNNIDLIHQHLPEAVAPLRAVYADNAGEIDLSSFFFTLVVHELGHTYHQQYPFQFPRLWLQELFANLCNHVCLADFDSELLELLVTFPKWLSCVPSSAFEYNTWYQFEEFYPPEMPGDNYGWYQSHLKVLAGELYESHGESLLSRIWRKFAVSDADLCRSIDEELSLGLSDFIVDL